MNDNTLITFLLPSVHHTGSVDLYGSWDNFTKPYPMTKDTQMGHGHWYGCHQFKNVICDGDPSNCTMPRDGSLRMGGTYWYYYKRDGDLEFHNPHEPSTASCPLIPGQIVNVLYVPHMVSSALSSISEKTGIVPGLTMDPEKRWKTPQPPRKLKLPTSAEVAPRLPTTNLKSRELWFSESLGRLQTAVVEHVLTGYNGIDLDAPVRRPRKLSKRQTRTADGPSCTDFDLAPLSPQTLRSGSLRQVKPTTTRPQSRIGRPTDDDTRPRSSRLFSNPFEQDLPLHLDEPQDGSLSSVGSESWAQQGGTKLSPISEGREYYRPLSAPYIDEGRRESPTTATLPRRSKTHVCRSPQTRSTEASRDDQVLANLLASQTLDHSHNVAPVSNSSKAHVLEPSETTAPTHDDLHRCDESTDKPLVPPRPPNNHKITSPDLPSLSNLQLLDFAFSKDDASPAVHSVHTKYDCDNDLWTPATSPSKGQSGFNTASQSNRSSMQQWSINTPLSPEMSPPAEWAVPGNADASCDIVAPHPPPPMRPPPKRPDLDVGFGASQETIKAVDSSNSPALARSSSLSIGKLPFESGGELTRGLFDGKRKDDLLSDLDLLGSSFS